MGTRFDLRAASPAGLAAMMALNRHVQDSGLDHALLELVRIRVSQFNGCAYCIRMHLTAARLLGVEQQRLDLLVAWKDAPCFGPQERAALDWAEALTQLPGGAVPDAAYEHVSAHFTPSQVAELAIAVAEINAWNRLMMGARVPPASAAL
jgi:AhpD family alkylhydroperoxidase